MVTAWVRHGEGCTQGRLLFLAQQRLTRSRMSATVAYGVRSSDVVAARNLANPVGGVSGEVGNGLGGEATR